MVFGATEATNRSHHIISDANPSMRQDVSKPGFAGQKDVVRTHFADRTVILRGQRGRRPSVCFSKRHIVVSPWG